MRLVKTRAVLILLSILAFSGTQVFAEPIPVQDLNESIVTTLDRPEFAWRLQPEVNAENQQGIIGSFIERLGDSIRTGLKTLERFADALGRWIEKLLDSQQDPTSTTFAGWPIRPSFVIVLAVLTIGLIGFYLWKRKDRHLRATDSPLEALPDLEEIAQKESDAAEVEATKWLQWAENLRRQGRRREAIRALYLGQLSSLANSGFLRLAFFKTNRDYRSELDRKAHHWPDLARGFSESVGYFEETWYGHRQDLDPAFQRLHHHLLHCLNHEAIR